MKVIYYSTAPHIGVGYGVITKEIVSRMMKDGHEVLVATKHNFGTRMNIDGIDIVDGTEPSLINKIAIDDKYDYVFSCLDHWTMAEPFSNWVAINMLDVEFIFTNMINVLKNSKYQVGVSKHGYNELKRVGFDADYLPLGVDSELFNFNEERRKSFREKFGWDDDTFVIGMVGINYNTDRKNIIGTIRAFQNFHNKYPNSVLYLHTDVMGSGTKGLPILWVMNSCGFDTSNSKGSPVRFVNQRDYHFWSISKEELAATYNGIDVFCLPTFGEGFGMPLLECQSSGTPLIVSQATGCDDLCFGGWPIEKQEDWYTFSTHLSWYIKTPPSAIEQTIEKAYLEWKEPTFQDRRLKAREGAVEYNWDIIYDRYWRPFLKKLENRKLTVKELPNFNDEIYTKFSGSPLMCDCNEVCARGSCIKYQTEKFPLLPGEENAKGYAIPTLMRSYPLFPNEQGDLIVDTNCDIYKYLSTRFVKECRDMWKILYKYPKIRKAVSDILKSDFAKDMKFEDYSDKVDLSSFNGDYARILQSKYSTTFDVNLISKFINKDDTVLDIGTGDGRRLATLELMGARPLGTEINPRWVNDSNIIYGEINKLPFSDNSFDLVMSVDVLEHIDKPINAIKEMFRVSKKYVVVQVTTSEDATINEDITHITKWDWETWKRELAEFGTIVDSSYSDTYVVLEKKSV
jgi:glycosyltransferase involved in cell wall biosynthesis/SAM-dependent methyltransferase